MRIPQIFLVAATFTLTSSAYSETAEDLFLKTVYPAFKAKCFKCHGPKKAKEELRLHAGKYALKGGEHGKVIIPGKPEESKLLKLVKLSTDDDDVMPPKEPYLTAAEIAAIEFWIKQGAPWPHTPEADLPIEGGDHGDHSDHGDHKGVNDHKDHVTKDKPVTIEKQD